MTSTEHEELVARTYREEYGRCVATLTRVLGDLSLAEDMVQEAFTAALTAWPDAVPPNPGAWIVVTARNRAIDRLRREAKREQKHAEALVVHAPTKWEEVGPVADDQLRLIFTCCHPALAPDARVALTLRTLGGLTTTEVARAFLMQESTIAQRIVRAKKKIATARIPYRIPADHDLPDRLGSVLAVIYLIFTQGYSPSVGAELVRTDLCVEAVRLARLLAELMPDEEEAVGLLALLLLTESRRPARTGPGGELVPLTEQDRNRWDHDLISEGQALVRWCLRRNRPGAYQVQAAIAAVHSDAATAGATDWRQILALYDQLQHLAPSPVVALNRAVALAEVAGPEQALAAVGDLDLDGYYLLHATRADLLTRLGRTAEAVQAWRRAGELTENDVERRFIASRLSALG
ncbi:RNA polymerase sigma factor [Ruania halotolerans]|uniref:RNA polymerase sigma factor n=1 Tax=Ruania halotolerans TaxID=2897773 RepID=UPI001E3F9E83|nr:RNA polymerase sigma factor [Ruania halotolerans]UFU06243.1 RNA polymerase sigma factor [Ruania halotolerans]